ncbi:hypothetical protein J6590_102557 [Homalodisca vitripennis]|nr:hypothetical protein J6590_102557 [Homalodisca vitripennis]
MIPAKARSSIHSYATAAIFTSRPFLDQSEKGSQVMVGKEGYLITGMGRLVDGTERGCDMSNAWDLRQIEGVVGVENLPLSLVVDTTAFCHFHLSFYRPF